MLSINSRHKLSTNVHLIVHLVLALIIWSNRNRTPLEVAPHSSMASRSLTPTDAKWEKKLPEHYSFLSFFFFSLFLVLLQLIWTALASQAANVPVPPCQGRHSLNHVTRTSSVALSKSMLEWLGEIGLAAAACSCLDFGTWADIEIHYLCLLFLFFSLSLFYAPWTINGCYLTYWRFSGSSNSL